MEGAALTAVAVDAGWSVEGVYVDADAADEGTSGLEGLALPERVAVHRLARGVVGRVATTEAPRPLVAVVERRVAELDVVDAASFLLVADAVADPGNAGTILRSAEAAGATAVVFTAGAVDPFNPKVVRSSAGALFHVPVVVDVTLDAVAARARRAAVRVVGTSSHRGRPHTVVDLTSPVAVVVGHEARGLADDAPVDEWTRIEHEGRAESLNVAMAATVLAFEVARQRRAIAGGAGAMRG